MTTATEPRRILYERPSLYPKQLHALFCPERWAVVEASTKAGKTVGCLCWIHEQAALEERALRALGQPGQGGGPGRNFWWVAPVNSVSKIAYRRLKRFLPDDSFGSNDTEQTITLANESVIWFKSGEKPDHLYGEDVYAAVVDEATRVKPDAWVALRTTLTATGGPARIIGNVKGSKNWAYRLARKAEAGADGYAYAKLTVWDAVDAGIFPASEALDAKDQLTDAEFRELYLAEASDTDDQFFHVEQLVRVKGYPEQTKTARAWDLAATELGDYTVGAKLAWDGQFIYIVDVVRERGEPERVLQLVRSTAQQDGPTCDQVFEEEKASAGKMLLEQMKQMLKAVRGAGRVYSAPVSGDKAARAFVFASRVNEGKARIVVPYDVDDPDPANRNWDYEGFESELDMFPVGDHDDQVDAAAHAHNHLIPKLRRPGRSRVPGSG